jgi:2-amino-4-hydroxy-6-hydroxymethyldihydropteridine diphosphokinase
MIAFGSNVGNRLGNLRRAADELGERAGRITARSGVYETPPWGVASQRRFLNACVIIETDESPRGLLMRAKDTEQALGRKIRERWGPREIDVDILTYGEISSEDDDLVIPHPLMTERAFVLVPVFDIAPGWKHPVTGEPLRELLEKTDKTGIIRITSL